MATFQQVWGTASDSAWWQCFFDVAWLALKEFQYVCSFSQTTAKHVLFSAEVKTQKLGKIAVMRYLHDDSGEKKMSNITGYRLQETWIVLD